LAFEFTRHDVGGAGELVEQARHQAIGLLHERQGHVLNIHRLVPTLDRGVLRTLQGFLGLLGEFVEVHTSDLSDSFFGGRLRGGRSGRCPDTPFEA